MLFVCTVAEASPRFAATVMFPGKMAQKHRGVLRRFAKTTNLRWFAVERSAVRARPLGGTTSLTLLV